MDFHQQKLLLVVFALVVGGSVGKAWADTMVTGTVFCDQCRDGGMTLLDYPLSGAKVALSCPGSDGIMAVWKELATNWLGSYTVRLPGTPDLSQCTVQVIPGSSSSCGASAAGPAHGVNLFFSMFGMVTYTVDTLLSQPAQPMGFCQRPGSGSPFQGPSPPIAMPTLPAPRPPVFRLPPLPPSMQASACPYENWMNPEYKCHWRVVEPDTKVAVAFGLVAAGRYGTDMTLWEGLQGRGDRYKTLLSESTTALLNSYNSLQFRYPTLSVIYLMNTALLGSPQDALIAALRFKRANAGSGSSAQCTLTPCK